MNVASIMAFYFLLIAALKRYNFSTRLAVIITIFFTLVNVPALRTLYYGQVNLHMVNFILLALVLYPRQRFLSALALAVAVHLKVSPIIIAFVFLLERDWRWIIYFGIGLVLVVRSPFSRMASHLITIFYTTARKSSVYAISTSVKVQSTPFSSRFTT